MSANSTRSETELQIFERSGSVRERASGTHILFAVLATFYWCIIIGSHQLTPFCYLRARSERNVGNNLFCMNSFAQTLLQPAIINDFQCWN